MRPLFSADTLLSECWFRSQTSKAVAEPYRRFKVIFSHRWWVVGSLFKKQVLKMWLWTVTICEFIPLIPLRVEHTFRGRQFLGVKKIFAALRKYESQQALFLYCRGCCFVSSSRLSLFECTWWSEWLVRQIRDLLAASVFLNVYHDGIRSKQSEIPHGWENTNCVDIVSILQLLFVMQVRLIFFLY